MSEVQAASGPAPKLGKYVKVSLYLKKLPHVSDDHFHAYWANNHLVPAFAHKKFMDKVRRYNQVSASCRRCFGAKFNEKSITSPLSGARRQKPLAFLSWSMTALRRFG